MRKLSFICLNHPHTVEWVDDGNGREGPNDQRQAIIRRVEKRVEVPGMMNQPMYRLAVAPAINDPEFDQRYLYNDTGLIFPHEKWLEERAKRCKASAEKARTVEEEAQKKAGVDMVANMTAFVSSMQLAGKVAQQIPSAPSVVNAEPKPAEQEDFQLASEPAPKKDKK